MTYPHPDQAEKPAALSVHANFGAGTNMTFDEMQRCAKMFLASGLFSTKGGPIEAQIAQLAVKIMAGQELGVPAYAAARGIDIINGQVAPDAGLTAALVKGSGRYRYHVAQWDAQSCLIHWYELVSSEWLALGSSSFTLDEAKTAGLMRNAAWTHYPKAMLWARAMTQGARAYCPDIFIGAVYTREELGEAPPPQDVTPAPPPPPPTNTVTPHDPGTVMAGEVIEHEVKPLPVYVNPNPPPVDHEAIDATLAAQFPEVEAIGNGEAAKTNIAAQPEHWTPVIEAAATPEACDLIFDWIVGAEDNKFRQDGALKRLKLRRAALVAAGEAIWQQVDQDIATDQNEATDEPRPLPEAPAAWGSGWKDPDTGEIHPEPIAPRLDFWLTSIQATASRVDCVATLDQAKAEVGGHPAQWRWLMKRYSDHMMTLPATKPPKKVAKKQQPVEQTYDKRGDLT